MDQFLSNGLAVARHISLPPTGAEGGEGERKKKKKLLPKVKYKMV